MKLNKIIIFPLILVLFLSACSSVEETQSSEDALALIHTSVAMTLTGEPLSATETETPEPTATPTIEETATLIASPTETTVAPTATTSYSYYYVAPTATEKTLCDDLTFISDITIDDGDEVAPGDSFTKTWKVQNTGSCDWDTDYSIVYVSGKRMQGSTTALTGEVESGDYLKISVSLVAPSSEGTYTGYWMMENDSGDTFGDTLHVEIEVDDSADTMTPKPSRTPTKTKTPTKTSEAVSNTATPIPNTATPIPNTATSEPATNTPEPATSTPEDTPSTETSG